MKCLKNLFNPINTMFLNALKVIVAPLVLFSIASSISDYGDLRSLGRIAGKILGFYFVTSLIAIAIGILTWHIFPIGNTGLESMVSDAANAKIAEGQGVSTSVVDTIVGIIPSEIINPFMKADMLQIIFMAAMIGIATGALSDKLCFFKEFLNDGYLVCSKITTMVISVMPVAIFCSMAKMVISTNIESLLSVLTWVPTIYFGDLLMLTVYGLMILILAGINPLTFFKKYFTSFGRNDKHGWQLYNTNDKRAVHSKDIWYPCYSISDPAACTYDLYTVCGSSRCTRRSPCMYITSFTSDRYTGRSHQYHHGSLLPGKYDADSNQRDGRCRSHFDSR